MVSGQLTQESVVVVFTELGNVAPSSSATLTRHLYAQHCEGLVAREALLPQQLVCRQQGRRQTQPLRAVRVPGVAVELHRSLTRYQRPVPHVLLGPEQRFHH